MKITDSKSLGQAIRARRLHGKNRDELYESDFVFGQTLHYVPDLCQMTILPYTNDFTFELLVGDEIQKLRGIHGFDNSLLVHNLTVAILEQEKIPFYSASVTNIASQAVAIRSGYMPLWTDTFGTRDIC